MEGSVKQQPCPLQRHICVKIIISASQRRIHVKIINDPMSLREKRKAPTHPAIDSVQRSGHRGLLV